MSMFCYQCEQTAGGTGCTVRGVCGKDAETAALQDLLLFALKGVARYAHCARGQGATDTAVNLLTAKALFSTVTNVNFDPERLAALIRDCASNRDKAKALCDASCKSAGKECISRSPETDFQPADSLEGLLQQAAEVGVQMRKTALGDDLAGLQELLTYGLKGAASYADHAAILGYEDDSVYAFFHKALDYLAKPDPSADELLGLCLECGKVNLSTMELLDAAHTSAYGDPVPTEVRITPVKGKAILISGHDLKDLEELLKQTEGTGLNVYTHGEMLPAHGYPGLKKYSHLVGNYGGAWQDQIKEFAEFPGAILMTTNCIQRPQDSYKSRIFTCGLVAWPGVTHIPDRDFKPVIDAALAAPGFADDVREKNILVGFGHAAVLSVADKVVAAVQAGKIRHFFLVGGCDGAKSGRNYYTDFAKAVPDDCVILTLACGKYRFNKLSFGDIAGIPRLLDVGQCNDAYSAVKIATALASAFETDVNSLPLSFILSWYEQKAVAILLTLLHLGITNIRIGPSLPAFVTLAVLNILVEKFNISPISTPAEDLKAILG